MELQDACLDIREQTDCAGTDHRDTRNALGRRQGYFFAEDVGDSTASRQRE